MHEHITASPLSWPVGWHRTPPGRRVYGRFNKKVSHTGMSGNTFQSSRNLSVADATERVLLALFRMNVDRDDIVISTDLELRLDGLPRSNQSAPADPGACAYWINRKGDRRCMAIDRYTTVQDNLAAIAATLEAMRAIERHGGAEILERAFTGFQALPNPASEPWWSVLGFDDESEALRESDFETAARRLIQQFHPDRPDGDAWRFNLIVRARDEGRVAAGVTGT